MPARDPGTVQVLSTDVAYGEIFEQGRHIVYLPLTCEGSAAGFNFAMCDLVVIM